MIADGELKVLATNALRTVILECIPQFDLARGHPTSVSFDSTNRLLTRISDGEAADLVIAADAAIGALAAQGKIITGSRVVLMSMGIGVCVRSGAPRPDVSSTEAFRQALLDAKSVAYTLTGQSGVHFSGVIERLGIAGEIKTKAMVATGGLIGEVVARGEADLGIQQISEILAVPGVDLVGPLPPELQHMTCFSAGICTGTRHPDAANAFVARLQSLINPP